MSPRGALAEELGKGLQNLLHGCESRTRLQIPHKIESNFTGDPALGQVAELVYATDLKSVALRLEGSSPSLPTILLKLQITFILKL